MLMIFVLIYANNWTMGIGQYIMVKLGINIT